jgi:hypothetical protein
MTTRYRAALVPLDGISELEFLFRVGAATHEIVSGILRTRRTLHSMQVIRQPNAYRLLVVVGKKKSAFTVEACVEAEDGMYRLSVKTPDNVIVAEGEEGIFHPLSREDLGDAADWLSEQVRESLTQ